MTPSAAPDVIILTARDDATADYLVPYLDGAGLTWVRWDPGSFPREAEVGATFDGSRWLDTEIYSANVRFRTDRRAVVWVRRPSEPAAPAANTRVTPERRFIAAESAWFFGGLWSVLPAEWVNHPDSGRIASYKPLQLEVAATLGFAVPRTYVGNSPGAVRALWEASGGNMVVKSLHETVVRGGAGADVMLYTTPLTASDISDAAAIKACPSIWQEYVEKDIEIRVTVVGHEVFAVEIHSQESPDTRNDWRRLGDTTPTHAYHALPHDVRDQCRLLTQRFGLHFGAIDIILGPKGYTFLEINPFGQWVWLEQLTNLPIAAAHVDLFKKLGAAAEKRSK